MTTNSRLRIAAAIGLLAGLGCMAMATPASAAAAPFSVSGNVSSMSGSYVTIRATTGQTYIVDVWNAAVTAKDGSKLLPSRIQNGDTLTVTGTLKKSSIKASRVVVNAAAYHAPAVVSTSWTASPAWTPTPARQVTYDAWNGYNGYASGSNYGSISLSLSPSISTLSYGQSVTITANANDADGVDRVVMYVNGSSVRTCVATYATSSGSCAFTVYANDYPDNSTISAYATVTDRYGAVVISSTTNVAVRRSQDSYGYYPYRNDGYYAQDSYPYAYGSNDPYYAYPYANNNVVVANNNGSGTKTQVAVSLSPSGVLFRSQTANAIADAYDSDGIAKVTVSVNGYQMGSCTPSGFPTHADCAVALRGSDIARGYATFYAEVIDRNGNSQMSSIGSLTVSD